MTDFLQHRGPDDVGVEEISSESGATSGSFGHRRLAILDLSTLGHQPMFSASRRLCMTYNGEIYNFMDLRRGLQQKGVTFKSACDTEVIVEGLELEGPQFLAQLRGMFALAVWDRVAGEGFLARDTFGIKPLYVTQCQGDIMFASEVRALLATGRVPRKLSAVAVQSYLSTGSVAEPFTIVEGISAVPPGCIVKVSRQGQAFSLGETQRFSAPFSNEVAAKRSVAAHAKRIRETLRESVRYHLVSDVPVAVFLSGGIDSTAVAGLASEVSETPIESFTVVFEEADFSEAEAARETAKRFRMRHHEIMLSGSDLLNALPDVFASMDQPSLDGLNTFVVSRAVRSFGLKVVLSGLGGDELFGGYPSFYRAERIASLWKLPRALRQIGANGAGSFEDPRLERVSTLLRDRSPARAAYRASRTLFSDRLVSRLMGAHRNWQGEKTDPDDVDVSKLTIAQQVSLYELTGYMRNTLLRDSDVFSMAHALELRVPLLDRSVAEVAHDAAADLHAKPGAVKPMLVEAVRDLLPKQNAGRPKMGFTLPFETWMRKEMASEVESVLVGGSAQRIQISQPEVKKIWDAFNDRRDGVNWSRPWALYTLMRWADQNGVSYEPSEIRGVEHLSQISLAG